MSVCQDGAGSSRIRPARRTSRKARVSCPPRMPWRHDRGTLTPALTTKGPQPMLNKLKLVLAACALSTIGNAQTYYSIDTNNDALYTVNVTSGAATFVGPLYSDLDGVDMAWHRGALYAKSFGTSN